MRSNDITRFEPVWISSPEYLRQFDALVARTSKWRRALGFYRFPAEFPRIDMGHKNFGQPAMVPLVMLAQGELTIEGDMLRFRALDLNETQIGQRTVTRLHLRTDWQWEMRAENISSVEAFERQSPLIANLSLPWTRVQARHREAALNDFLICVGANGFEMDKLREQSAELRTQLQTLKSA